MGEFIVNYQLSEFFCNPTISRISTRLLSGGIILTITVNVMP